MANGHQRQRSGKKMVSPCAMQARGSGVLTLGNVGVPWRWQTTHANQMLLHRSSMEEKKQRIDAARRITRSLGIEERPSNLM
jgi:hypothetical protein